MSMFCKGADDLVGAFLMLVSPRRGLAQLHSSQLGRFRTYIKPRLY